MYKKRHSYKFCVLLMRFCLDFELPSYTFKETYTICMLLNITGFSKFSLNLIIAEVYYICKSTIRKFNSILEMYETMQYIFFCLHTTKFIKLQSLCTILVLIFQCLYHLSIHRTPIVNIY